MKQIILLLIMAFSLGAISYMDRQDEELRLQIYCHDVALWELDKKNGVPQHDRYGHPNYKNIDCSYLVK